ncbi:hypothetical protein ACA910_011025 [Epithemia clementina (nom. ined.)]
MFVNAIAFLITLSRDLRFGTVEALLNRQANPIRDKLSSVIRLYQHRGFQVVRIYGDPEFEALRPLFPTLDTCGATDHVPDIERYIRTVQDRARSAYRMLPFQCLPRIVVVHLIRNAVFWLNAFPPPNGVSSTVSPRCLLTGFEVTYSRHVQLEFGEYVQTHEEHDNQMLDRTVGAICLGPTGNATETHYFLSLASGSRIARSRWSRLPITREVITCVTALGRHQRMPATLTFGDRLAHEIPEDDHSSDTNDDDYDPGDDDPDSDDDDLYYDSDPDDCSQADVVVTDDGTDASADGPLVQDITRSNKTGVNHRTTTLDDDDNDDRNDETESGENCYENKSEEEDECEEEDYDYNNDYESDYVDCDNEDEDPPTNDYGTNTGVDNKGVGNSGANTGVESTGVGGPDTDGYAQRVNANKVTELDRFAAAEHKGAEAACNNQTRPRRERKAKCMEDYVHAMIGDADPEFIFNLMTGPDGEDMFAFLTKQMAASAGLNCFGKAGAEAITCHAGTQGKRSDQGAKLGRPMLSDVLKQKRCGRIKGRGCTDGRKQCLYKSKDETSSPTISTEALFISCVIDAMEGRHVVTCDIPGAFMHADMDELGHLKLEGDIALLLVQYDPSYKDYLTYNRGRPVIYAELKKALYRTLHRPLSSFGKT